MSDIEDIQDDLDDLKRQVANLSVRMDRAEHLQRWAEAHFKLEGAEEDPDLRDKKELKAQLDEALDLLVHHPANREQTKRWYERLWDLRRANRV